jgi:hypothetical protein
MFDILLLLCVKKCANCPCNWSPAADVLQFKCLLQAWENKPRLDPTNWSGRFIGSILNVGNSKQLKIN